MFKQQRIERNVIIFDTNIMSPQYRHHRDVQEYLQVGVYAQ